MAFVITSMSSETKNQAIPNVRIASGSVTNLKSGFSIVLRTPKTAAAASRDPALATCTPFNTAPTTASTNAFVSHEIASRTASDGERSPPSAVVARRFSVTHSAYAKASSKPSARQPPPPLAEQESSQGAAAGQCLVAIAIARCPPARQEKESSRCAPRAIASRRKGSRRRSGADTRRPGDYERLGNAGCASSLESESIPRKRSRMSEGPPPGACWPALVQLTHGRAGFCNRRGAAVWPAPAPRRLRLLNFGRLLAV